ncbi:hypothetical protein BGZ63DRAFT_97108 [Mariannaea sp. PMI_226]|nr:hypothetical protein BGZ63DRAFT_97108 [Mariannaea sp. PMI_226]
MAERSGRSCQACKDRHLRCSKEWPCGNCTKAGLDCQKPGHFQFLHSKTPRFPDDQVWLSTADEIYFNTESGDILSTSDSEDPETRLRIPRETSPRPSEATLEDCADLAPNDEPLNGASRPLSSRAQTTYPGRHRHSTSVNFSAPIRSDEDDYHPASSGVHDGVFQNCGRSDSTPLHQDSRACLFPLSDTDAELTRYFFKTLASWVGKPASLSSKLTVALVRLFGPPTAVYDRDLCTASPIYTSSLCSAFSGCAPSRRA